MSAKTATEIKLTIPSDSEDLASKADGLHVNGSGNVKIKTGTGRTTTLYCLAGVPYPYEVTRVYDTGTTATGINVIYIGGQ